MLSNSEEKDRDHYQTNTTSDESKAEADTHVNTKDLHKITHASQTNDSEESSAGVNPNPTNYQTNQNSEESCDEVNSSSKSTGQNQTNQENNRLKSLGRSLGEHTKKFGGGIVEGVKNINEKHQVSGRFSLGAKQVSGRVSEGAKQVSGRVTEGAKQMRASVSASQVGSNVKRLNEEHKVSERVSDRAKKVGSAVKGFNANVMGSFATAAATVGGWRYGRGTSKAGPVSEPAATTDPDDDQSV